MNNCIYIRTSTEEQTPELQITDIATLVSINDCLIMKEQISAWKENVKRPEFEKILSLIKKEKISNLYVWSLDRLYRNRTKLTGFLRFCVEHKVKVYSFSQSWLNSIYSITYPFNEMMYDFMISILGWMGEEESLLKSKRVKMAVVRRNDKTLSHKGNVWGRKPFSSQIINKVKELHKQGYSIRAIANQIMKYDKNNNGQQISKSAVHKIISTFSA